MNKCKRLKKIAFKYEVCSDKEEEEEVVRWGMSYTVVNEKKD